MTPTDKIDKHPGQNCCPTCEDDREEGTWYLEGEVGPEICCCRALGNCDD